ncbi:MAG: hypothetical protein K8F92_10295 [Hyphomicrobium sp.]|uniref:hypothetical protein n=1 Tax=Hyphomicrobium sp. TaxID=82 RepID=UPI001328394A|nr:hypothetical protein [Hyphomicrobium sp.]KAB2941746.1 MAG: hypothetical protein F9K20_08330 [Hyphomicrobium sp.]MBZ0210027.1 hypothetical protein [Hyphomicrobium sp.]
MANCPSCGGSVAAGDRFCGACGRDLPTVPGAPSGHGGGRSLAAIGLVVVGALVLGAGLYQVIERSTEAPSLPASVAPPRATPLPPTPMPQPSETPQSAPAPAASSETAPAPPPAVGCANLLVPGAKIICSAFEPNWAIELICGQSDLTSNFIDAFSGDSMEKTSGPVGLSRENPWVFRTRQGFVGSIASTPGACRDESDKAFDFTLTPVEVPGVLDPQTACCRIER